MTGLSAEAIDRAAMIFAEARLNGTQVESLPPDLAPRDIAEAYAIQTRLAERLGWEIGGWFCGCTNRAIQMQLGLHEPYCAPLFRRLIHDAPARLSTRDFAPIVLECEFAFVLARDLPARLAPYSHEEVRAAVRSVHPAIEVVAGTLKDWQRQSPFAIIADNGVDGALVLGAGKADWRNHDLARIEVTLVVDGEPAQRGTGADVLGDPFNALVWLANRQAQYGPGLKAGQVHNTGTATRMQPVKTGERAVASFGALGQVELDLV